MISIIIPYFNAEKNFGATFRSVLNQTFQDFEVLIIDDHSSTKLEPDHLFGLANDTRISIYHQSTNKGPSAARNLGASKSTGEILCFLDSDDIWPEDYLHNVISVFESDNNVDVAVSKGYVFSNQKVRRPLNNGLGSFNQNKIWSNSIGCPSGVAIKRKVLDDTSFPEELRLYEDYVFYVRAALNGYTFSFSDNYFFYRIEDGNYSSFYDSQYVLDQQNLLLDLLGYQERTFSQKIMIRSVINSLNQKAMMKRFMRIIGYALLVPDLFFKYMLFLIKYLEFEMNKNRISSQFEDLIKN